MGEITKVLLETQTRAHQHVWTKTKYAASNQNGSNGLSGHNDGIISGGVPINQQLMDWWCEHSGNHGYGIFHQGRQNQITGSYTLVSFNSSPFKYILIIVFHP